MVMYMQAYQIDFREYSPKNKRQKHYIEYFHCINLCMCCTLPIVKHKIFIKSKTGDMKF